jgi:hypothetical protein
LPAESPDFPLSAQSFRGSFNSNSSLHRCHAVRSGRIRQPRRQSMGEFLNCCLLFHRTMGARHETRWSVILRPVKSGSRPEIPSRIGTRRQTKGSATSIYCFGLPLEFCNYCRGAKYPFLART